MNTVRSLDCSFTWTLAVFIFATTEISSDSVDPTYGACDEQLVITHTI